jgi:type II secretory pathway pseudopilin PulG
MPALQHESCLPLAFKRVARAAVPGFRSRRAASLLELVVVAAIIAVLSAVAIPHYGYAMCQRRVASAAQRVGIDLTAARERARLSSASYAVAFSITDGTYSIYPEPSGGLEETEVVNLRDPPYRAEIYSVDFHGNIKVVFNGFGLPEGNVGGSVVIQVGSAVRTITVDGETGEVTVQ